MRFLFVILFFAAIPGSLLAKKEGQALIDSLVKELPAIKSDTEKVIVLNNLCNDYRGTNPAEGTKYGQEAVALAEKMQWKRAMARANNGLGVNYYLKGDYPNALEYLLKSQKAAEEIRDTGIMSMDLGNIGVIYYVQGNHALSLEYFLKGLKVAEERKDTVGAENIYSNIGNIYYDLTDYPKALEYFFKALKIGEITGDKNSRVANLCNIGAVYTDAGNYDSALIYLFKAMAGCRALGDSVTMANIYGNIGESLSRNKDYLLGITYGLVALKMDQSTGNKRQEDFVLNALGIAYLGLATDTPGLTGKQPASLSIPAGEIGQPGAGISTNKATCLHLATSYFTQGLALAKETNILEVMKECYKGLSETYKRSGDYRRSLECFQNYAAINDSAFSKKYENKLAAITSQYELDKKQTRISLLEKDNLLNATKIRQQAFQRNALILSSLLLLGLIVVASLAWMQRKTKNMQVAFSRSLLQSQETERQRISRELHDSVGQNILFIKNQLSLQNNHSLAGVMAAVDSTIEDVRNMSKDLYPNQLEKYGLSAAVDAIAEKVNAATGIFVSADLHEIETALSKNAKINIFRIIQESLNNVIKHAGAKAVRITGNMTKNNIALVIMDNGKGFDTGILERKSQTSYGLLNMEERAKMLGGKMELESAATGTKITFTIPVANEV